MKRIRPAAAVGFGGYPTVPPMLAASRAEVPTVIHEANAVIGRANRFLAPHVSAIATSFDRVSGAEKFVAKMVDTGNPVRPAVLAAADAPYPPRAADAPFNLLVFGGSQGAHFLSDLAPAGGRPAPASSCAAGSGSCSSAGPRISIGSTRPIAGSASRPSCALLPRPAGAHRGEPPRPVACRRFDHLRARRDRPAGDHGAAAARARPGPEGQRPGARPCRRRLDDRAARHDARSGLPAISPS